MVSAFILYRLNNLQQVKEKRKTQSLKLPHKKKEAERFIFFIYLEMDKRKGQRKI
jgi:hypothetical protein